MTLPSASSSRREWEDCLPMDGVAGAQLLDQDPDLLVPVGLVPQRGCALDVGSTRMLELAKLGALTSNQRGRSASPSAYIDRSVTVQGNAA